MSMSFCALVALCASSTSLSSDLGGSGLTGVATHSTRIPAPSVPLWSIWSSPIVRLPGWCVRPPTFSPSRQTLWERPRCRVSADNGYEFTFGMRVSSATCRLLPGPLALCVVQCPRRRGYNRRVCQSHDTGCIPPVPENPEERRQEYRRNQARQMHLSM